jgi:sulfide dehydrogenase [flavocytochrome c] flavoprotein chain
MRKLTRRTFLGGSGAAMVGAAMAGGLAGRASTMGETQPTGRRRVVVIGGGWGGATAAKYVRMGDPRIDVVLLEPNLAAYYSSLR